MAIVGVRLLGDNRGNKRYPDNGYILLPSYGNNSSNTIVLTPNHIIVFLCYIKKDFLCNYLTFNITVAVSKSISAVGLYSFDGNSKLLDSGILSGATTGGHGAAQPSVFLEGNNFYWQAMTFSVSAGQYTSIGYNPLLNNSGNQIVIGEATNQCQSPAILPLSLGTILSNSRTNMIQMKLIN